MVMATAHITMEVDEAERNLLLRLRQLAREGEREVLYDLQQRAIIQRTVVIQRIELMQKAQPAPKTKPAPAQPAGA